MPGVELTLKAATLALAGAAIYLTTLLVAERGRATSAAEQRQSLEARAQGLERARAQSSEQVSLIASATPASPSRASSLPVTASVPERPRGSYALPQPTLQERLTRLADPTIRATMLRLRQDEERRLNPGLRQALGISVEEEDQLLALLSEQDLRNEEQELRDAIAGRRFTKDTAALDDDVDQKLNALLGEERMKRWDSYQDTLPERRSVIDLRARLGGVPLSESVAQQLTEAMRDERARFATETRQLAGTSTYNDSYPERARLNSEDLGARLKFREDQIARTVEYYARIRERAAAFLSVEQVQRLEDIHESTLANLRANLLRGRKVEEEMKKLRAAPPPSDQ